MSSQELVQTIVPPSPPVDANPQNSPDTPFTNLFEDVALVKNHLDCLGLKYNPDNIADLLLQYDSNANRVNLVVNRIIDEPPDVEITFEGNSPNKTFVVNSGHNGALENDDSIIEIKSVKKDDDDVILEKITKNETPRVVESDDDFSPSPTKFFKFVNPGKNPFSSDLFHKEETNTKKLPPPDFPFMPSTSNGRFNDVQKPEDQIVNMSEIEEFLNNKDSHFLDAAPNPVLNQSFAKLNQRLKELKNSGPKASDQMMKKVLKSASTMAKQDLQSGVISPLNRVENGCSTQTNSTEMKTGNQTNPFFSISETAVNGFETGRLNSTKTNNFEKEIQNNAGIFRNGNERKHHFSEISALSESTKPSSHPLNSTSSELPSISARSSVSQLSNMYESLSKEKSIPAKSKNSFYNHEVDGFNFEPSFDTYLSKNPRSNVFKFPGPSATVTKESELNPESTKSAFEVSKPVKLTAETRTLSASNFGNENVENSGLTSGLLDCSNDIDFLSNILEANSSDLESETSILLLNNAVEVLEGTKKKVDAPIKESAKLKSGGSTSKTVTNTQSTKFSDLTFQIESNNSAVSDIDEILDLAFIADPVGKSSSNETSKSNKNNRNLDSSLPVASTSKVKVLPREEFFTRSTKNHKIFSTDASLSKAETKASSSGVTNSKNPSVVASSSKFEVEPSKASASGDKTGGSENNVHRPDETLIIEDDVEPAPSTSKGVTERMPKYLPNLMEIFPDADTGYLRDLFKNVEGKVPDQQILQLLIDKVMENPNYPRRKLPNVEPTPMALSVDEKYQSVSAIFPNIDPEFLENKCKELTDDEKYSAFINELLTTKQYPTLKDYERRKETEKSIKAYTDNFTISGFLEVFPDPEDYFLNQKKSGAHQEHSMAFLKDRYKLLRADEIARAFKQESCNLTKTCLRLDAHAGPFRKTRRNAHECKWPAKNDVNFLQEISYIKNRTEIKQFIENKKKEKEDAFKSAKENNELFTCGCCYDDEVMKDDVITCEDGHIFCIGCVKRLGEIKLGERCSKIQCMASECETDFTLKDLQKALPPNAFSRFVKLKQSDEIKAAGIEGLVSCPFCDFASIPPPEDKIFKCLNPDCMKEFCRLCNEESHVPFRCDEVERNTELKARLLIEEKMTEALMRECYKCKTKFIKEDGCNKMTCVKCGALSCYICRQPVQNYDHFNGDNGPNVERCPLYSENDLLHVDAVRFTAQEIKSKLLKENPNLNLKVDPTLVLPENTYNKKKAVPHFRQNQRGLVLNRAIPADVPRDNLPPIDLRPPEPVIPPHLLPQNVPQHRNQILQNAALHIQELQRRLIVNGANVHVQAQYHAPIVNPPAAAYRAQPHNRPRVQHNGAPRNPQPLQAPRAPEHPRHVHH